MAIYAHLNYIDRPGVYILVIKSVEKHKNGEILCIDTYTNDTEHPLKKTIWLELAQLGNSKDVQDIRNKIIKEFFTNAGADFEKYKGLHAAKSVIGKKVKVLFREEEYVGYHSNGKPKIDTIIRYLYSGPVDQQLGGNQSYLHKRLSETELQKFYKLLNEWEATHDTGGKTKTSN